MLEYWPVQQDRLSPTLANSTGEAKRPFFPSFLNMRNNQCHLVHLMAIIDASRRLPTVFTKDSQQDNVTTGSLPRDNRFSLNS
ncbi:hypothetical protein T06_14063 [Trichinella sp. T6]|nr:hypothetical protein T06_14063 [Trichinella sp. T6]